MAILATWPGVGVTVHGGCPDFRGVKGLRRQTSLIAAKMGLSPSALAIETRSVSEGKSLSRPRLRFAISMGLQIVRVSVGGAGRRNATDGRHVLAQAVPFFSRWPILGGRPMLDAACARRRKLLVDNQ